jgi:hypothetical protein
MTRKIVQISTSAGGANKMFIYLHALCSDGTVWRRGGGEGWTKLPDIPQDEEPKA